MRYLGGLTAARGTVLTHPHAHSISPEAPLHASTTHGSGWKSKWKNGHCTYLSA